MAGDVHLERLLLQCAKDLLATPASRRGPYIITDAQLKHTIEALEKSHDYPVPTPGGHPHD